MNKLVSFRWLLDGLFWILAVLLAYGIMAAVGIITVERGYERAQAKANSTQIQK